MLTVLAWLVVIVTYIALAESLATVKLLSCAPLPLSVCVSLIQLVTVSLRPPYHLTTLLTVEEEPFITDHIAPRTKAELTYLKQTPLAGTAYDPPPVMTVGVAHRLPPGTGVLVGVFVGPMGVFVGVLLGTDVFVGVFDATGVLVGVLVGPVGVLVRVGVFDGASVFVGVLVGPVGVFVRVGVEPPPEATSWKSSP